MGAQNFVREINAISATEGFNRLVKEDRQQYGMDNYSGGINNTRLGKCVKVFNRISETSKKSAYKYIESLGYGERYIANYIDMGVVEYRAVTYKKVKSSGEEPVIRVRYVVREHNYLHGFRKFIKWFENKKDADDYALKLSIRDNKGYYTSKEGVLISGDSQVTTIEKEVKTYKSKPNLKTLPNRRVYEIRKYLFFGWSSI